MTGGVWQPALNQPVNPSLELADKLYEDSMTKL